MNSARLNRRRLGISFIVTSSAKLSVSGLEDQKALKNPIA